MCDAKPDMHKSEVCFLLKHCMQAANQQRKKQNEEKKNPELYMCENLAAFKRLLFKVATDD